MSDKARVRISFTEPSGALRMIDHAPGVSVMEAAVEHEIVGIEAQCYGAGVCGTCHVYIEQPWLAATGGTSEWEQEMLGALPLSRANSRLSCQVVLRDTIDGARFVIPERQESLE